MKDLAGNNLNAAVTFLATLSEFEDERGGSSGARGCYSSARSTTSSMAFT
jgi:hypothetical protein